MGQGFMDIFLDQLFGIKNVNTKGKKQTSVYKYNGKTYAVLEDGKLYMHPPKEKPRNEYVIKHWTDMKGRKHPYKKYI